MATTATPKVTASKTEIAAVAKATGLNPKSGTDTAIITTLIVADKKAGGDGSAASIREGINSGEAWVANAVGTFASSGAAYNIGKAARQVSAAGRAGAIEKVVDSKLDKIAGQDITVDISPTGAKGVTSGKKAYYAADVTISGGKTTQQVEVPVYETRTSTQQVTSYETVTRTGVYYTQDKSSDISYSMIPYMRSIPVLVVSKGMKPNTTLNAYFDNISVNEFISPATKLSTTPVTGQPYAFNNTLNAGNPTIQRQIDNSPINTLMTGDVITGVTSGATAVLVGTELNNSTINRDLFVVNVKGTFQAGEQITGSLSGSKGVITTISTPTTIQTTNYGSFYGIFRIPNTIDKKIPVGQKTFLLTSSTNTSVNADTFSKTEFISNGTLQTIQPIVTTIANTYTYQTTQAVTNNVQVSEQVQVGTATATVITNEGFTTVGTGKVVTHAPHEPLAQTFYVAEPNGVCLTGVDLFFASKDDALPVKLAITNVERGGQPGLLEVPFSQVVKPADEINVSSLTVVAAVDGKEYYAPDTPTRFEFVAPVYLEGNQSYCIFLATDSFKYNVWTSYMGDATVNGQGIVTKQPQMGTLFKSQNAVSWSTDQLQDLCFKLYRAKFTTGTNVTIPFENNPLTSKEMVNSIRATAGSNKLRVYYRNHGMVDGNQFTLSGFQDPHFGIPASELNATFTVSNTELDWFVITTTTAANASGIIDEVDIFGTRNVRYEQLRPNIGDLVVPQTKIVYQYRGTDSTGTKQSNYKTIVNYKQTDMEESQFILSPVNETYYTSTLDGKSLDVTATLSTQDEYVSPFINSQRLSLIATGNKINSPTIAMNVADIDFAKLSKDWASETYVEVNNIIYFSGRKYAVTAGGKLGTSGPVHTTGSATNGTATLAYLGTAAVITVDDTNNRFQSSDSYVQAMFSNVLIGSYVTVTGCSTTANNGTYMVTDVSPTGSYITVDKDLASEASTTIAIMNGLRYRDEITPAGSSSIADYVTRELTFSNLSTAFKLIFTYNLPVGTDIKFYFKSTNSFDSTIHADQSYTELEPTSALVSSTNKDDLFRAEYQLENMDPFNTLSVKIVYTSSDTTKFPRMRDFRIIALA